MSGQARADELVSNRVQVGDVREILPSFPSGSVDCIITSPPYYRLRNYGAADQLGLEASVTGWVDELRLVLRGLARVLKPTGSLWLNLGDSFSSHESAGAPLKSLLMAPERLALAMIEDGWTIRSKVIWAKTNPMPTSVRDRLACTWEVVYFATRSRHYWFDLDAIRIPHHSAVRSSERAAARGVIAKKPDWAGPLAGSNNGLDVLKARGLSGHPLGKNPGDVWRLPTARSGHGHHATFPVDLITKPLLASCPERVCLSCGTPWTRTPATRGRALATVGEPKPACECNADWQPGVVLDPFMGSGTVAIAAETHTRDWLGIELNPDFARIAEQRIAEARTRRDAPADRSDLRAAA